MGPQAPAEPTISNEHDKVYKGICLWKHPDKEAHAFCDPVMRTW